MREKKVWLKVVFTTLILVATIFPSFNLSADSYEIQDSRYEYYNSGDNTQAYIYGLSNIYGQTFTVGTEGDNVSHTITNVSVKVFKSGSVSGNMEVEIRSTSGGDPNSVLSTGNVTASSLPSSADWVSVDMTSYELQQGTMYAIIVMAPDCDEGDDVGWRIDSASSAYGGGTATHDFGGGWTPDSAADHMFEIYGTTGDEESIVCTSSGYEYGNWSFTEHVVDGTLDSDWTEENDSAWYPYTFGYPMIYNPISNGEGDGALNSGALMFIGDNIGDTLVYSEFNFTPNVTGTLYGLNIHVNHTLNTGSHPDEFDIYIDSGGVDHSIDGTKVKDAWSPSWSVGWKQVYFDTNYSVTAGTTYEVQFQTMDTDNEDDFDRLYISKDDNASGYNMTVYGGSSWSNYSYVGEILYNITVGSNLTVYQFNATTSTHSYTIMNDTGCNRTQWLGFINVSYTGEPINPIYPYIIYAFNNDSDFDCLFFDDNFATFAHWDGEFFYNLTNQGQLMGEPTTLYNYWSQDYEDTSYLDLEGSYFKLIYNELSGEIKFKKWFDFLQEPAGWAVQEKLYNSTYSDFRCHGIGVWNEADENGTVNWDYLNLWQLQYSLNITDYCNISGRNESRPHMDFPTMNLSNYVDWYGYINNEDTEDVTLDQHKEIMRILTNNMSMESRMYILPQAYGDDQNDNIYYYSSVYDSTRDYINQSTGQPAPDWLFDEYLHLHVQMCPDKQINVTEYDDCFVAIDVDNDREWDNNDRIFWIYAHGSDYDVVENQFNGFDDIIIVNFNGSIWKSNDSAVGNIHRYTSFMNYAFNIPLVELVKSDGNPLTVGDTFGLHIVTSMNHDIFGAVWQNWNETDEDPYFDESNFTVLMNHFMNSTWTEGALDVHTNSTSLEKWGEGYISLSEEFNQTDEIVYYVITDKFANVSVITDIDTYNLVNYTINLTLMSSGSVTNVKINDTLQDGISIVGTDLPPGSITNPYGNTYIINVTDTLSGKVTFNITVNFSANCLPNGTNFTNVARQYNDQNANSTGSDWLRYGDNQAPVVDWIYPANSSMDTLLLLANISAYVRDEDADPMDVHFYTNKTDNWTGSWHLLSSNISVNDGMVWCDQTFNNSNEYNTRWRWGNTTYFWSINITDGLVWTNNTYHYETEYSRYNVNSDDLNKVNALDLSVTWGHRTFDGTSSYYGIYDVNADGSTVNALDLSAIWGNKIL